MKISIVTISYNQAEFLEKTILSVIEQDYDKIEYIVVDPGSTDGSRKIIDRYRSKIDKVIFEHDEGPSDGLNKGFAYATGQIYGFLNSDDFFLPHAVRNVARFFSQNVHIDVLSGHAIVVNEEERMLRKFYSDKYSLRNVAYGASTIVQQSTFFKSKMFGIVGGFNKRNNVAWDGEIFIDMALSGANFCVLNSFLSAFRLHKNSITSSMKLADSYSRYKKDMFYKIIKREPKQKDKILRFKYKALQYKNNPRSFYERLLHGPIAGHYNNNYKFNKKTF